MTINEVREKYLKFYESRGHKIIPSAPLVPQDDPTTLFTGSGMQPLISYFLGEEHPAGKRVADSQKCFRAEDIEEVGDNRHTTFFEMLGNWSFGDYFKKEQLPWVFEFLTEEIGLDPKSIYVTVFAGDAKNNIPKDSESPEIWQELFASKGIEAKVVELDTLERGAQEGMQGGRIFYYGAKKNWWSRWGSPENMPIGEPGGPDSEIFYDFGTPHDEAFGKECHPNCDCGRFLEIGNSVFMEYKKVGEGRFEPLQNKNVDFGGGLERITAASINNADVFQIDVFKPLVDSLPKDLDLRAKRIVADHLRASAFIISDGVKPSNKERGYVLRRLMRRIMVYPGINFAELIDQLVSKYQDFYPSLDASLVKQEFQEEYDKFSRALNEGLKELAKMKEVGSKEAFYLYESFGLPLDVLKDKIPNLDTAGFEEEFKKHQETSRTASAGAFKGGLVDREPQTIKHHTAHHLLLAALRQVLGDTVYQRGSNVSSERLRIDFSQGEKLTPEQLKQVEDIVNEKISEDLEVKREEMPKDEAEKLGAMMEFGAKYGDVVSVYTVYNKDGSAFSREFCGGPHVTHTGELGHFKIMKEEASSAGVRRIKAKVE